jgi:CBS domain containing-hemolysin-like protein
MSNDFAGIAWLVVLLLGNAFFVGAEFAVISARRSQIEPLADAGRASAKKALWAMEHATLMLATSQLGITICSLLILNVSEPAIHHLVEVPLHLTGWSEEVISMVSFTFALVLVSYLHVVLGEMVPKNLSFSVPDRAVLLLAPPLVFFATIFRPVIVALNAIANGVVRLFGVEPKNEATSTFTLEEVATIVSQSTKEGVLMDSSGTLSAAFEFTNRKVKDVAVRLDDLISLPETATPADVEKAVARYGFSRYVLRSASDDLIGYIHLKDVLDLDIGDSSDSGELGYRQPVPSKRIRQLISIFEETELEDALATMRRTGAHVVRSFNAAGETHGVLFLEDIIEELVGEVQDATRRI